MGLTLYLIPFLFATYPPLMLVGSWPGIIFALFKASLIAICFTAAMMGVLSRRLQALERLLFVAAGVLLWITIYPLLTNIVGFGVLALAVVMSLRRRLPAVA